jgi:CRP-like cAMP-binding protein
MANWFLASMSAEMRAELEPHLEAVPLKEGQMLYAAGDLLDWVYFPNSGLVATIITMQSGKTLCTSLVGRSGMLSTAVVLDLSRALDQAVVELAAYRRDEALRTSINFYHAMTFAEAQQSIACNALHDVEERVCRWLLEARDRTGLDRLSVTQELLANLLGVQRTSLTLAQGKLAKAGLIRTRRGHIDLVNIDGLHECSCECYDVLRKRAAVIFPTMPFPLQSN